MLKEVFLNLTGFRRNIMRQGTPEWVYYFEHGFSEGVKNILKSKFDITTTYPESSQERIWADEAALYGRLGMELFRVFPPGGDISTIIQNGKRWIDEHKGPISNWNDFEKFPWPDPLSVDYAQIEWYERNLPDNMGIFVKTTIWEVVQQLFGYETFCYLLFEDTSLVEAVIEKVGQFYTDLVNTLCNFTRIFAVYGSDDFGFKTSLLIRPEVIRKYFFPWHKQWSQAAHANGKFYFLHSCGQLKSIMEDIIEDIRIDAKHSFEEVITPVDEAKKLWGDRLALLGGLDVDYVARESKDAVSRYARRILNRCVPGGGYCLGLGNWVTSYIPIDNYLAILNEGKKWHVCT